MKESNLISELKGIGLTGSEANVYFHLLRKKNFTATEISKLTQVPQSKIYGILAKLVQKGLCTETLGKVKKYSSVNPEVGFDNLCNELEKKKKRISDLSKVLLPLYHSEKEKTDPLDYIKVLRDKNSIVEKYKSLEIMAKYEVLSLVKGPYAMDTNNQKSSIEQIASLKKEVKYKTIYKFSEMEELNFLKAVEILASAGEEVKISYNIPFKMFIFDRKTVMFTLEDRITSKPSLTTLIVEHRDLAKGLKQVFNLYWQNSMTFEEFKIKEKIKK